MKTDVEAIKKRVEAATMWKPEECELEVDPDDEDGRVYAPQGATIGHTLIQLGDSYEGYGEDWNFVAHARTDVPALISVLEEIAQCVPEDNDNLDTDDLLQMHERISKILTETGLVKA